MLKEEATDSEKKSISDERDDPPFIYTMVIR